jgi:DNA-binding NtrC family response regulator
MKRSTARILCVDSSPQRLRELTDALEKAGFEVWTASGAGDALCLVSGLHFEVVAIDQMSVSAQTEVWNCLAESHTSLPILVHSGVSRMSTLCRNGHVISSGPSGNHEIVLALLLLLLGHAPRSKVRKPQSIAA